MIEEKKKQCDEVIEKFIKHIKSKKRITSKIKKYCSYTYQKDEIKEFFDSIINKVSKNRIKSIKLISYTRFCDRENVAIYMISINGVNNQIRLKFEDELGQSDINGNPGIIPLYLVNFFNE